MIPDKEFKFYLASILILFILIYASQAIMVYRYHSGIALVHNYFIFVVAEVMSCLEHS